MIDLEALLLQILMLAVFGIIYAWIGGKIGFKSGIKAAKKEVFELFGINPKEWKTLAPEERRTKLTQIFGSLIRDMLKQAATSNPGTDETEENETEPPTLPDPEDYKK